MYSVQQGGSGTIIIIFCGLESRGPQAYYVHFWTLNLFTSILRSPDERNMYLLGREVPNAICMYNILADIRV